MTSGQRLSESRRDVKEDSEAYIEEVEDEGETEAVITNEFEFPGHVKEVPHTAEDPPGSASRL
jgi:hypothetical protein